MIQAKCVKIHKDDSGNITKFDLVYTDGSTKTLNQAQLRVAVENDNLDVVNLKLNKNTSKPSKQDKIRTYMRNAMAFGKAHRVVHNLSGKVFYICSPSFGDYIIYIPDDMTSCQHLLKDIIEYDAFNDNLYVLGCKNVEDMSAMFFNYVNTKNIDLSCIDTHKVVSMASMFENCRSLRKLNLSNFDTSQVVTFSNMFNGCEVLTELDISSFTTCSIYNASALDGIFNRCLKKYMNLKCTDKYLLERFNSLKRNKKLEKQYFEDVLKKHYKG